MCLGGREIIFLHADKQLRDHAFHGDQALALRKTLPCTAHESGDFAVCRHYRLQYLPGCHVGFSELRHQIGFLGEVLDEAAQLAVEYRAVQVTRSGGKFLLDAMERRAAVSRIRWRYGLGAGAPHFDIPTGVYLLQFPEIRKNFVLPLDVNALGFDVEKNQ